MRFSLAALKKRGILTHIAEQAEDISSRLQSLENLVRSNMSLSQSEQAAVDRATAAIAKLSQDVDRLVTTGAGALAAKDGVITALQAKLDAAMQQDAADVAELESVRAEIDSMKSAADVRSQEFVGALDGLAASATEADGHLASIAEPAPTDNPTPAPEVNQPTPTGDGTPTADSGADTTTTAPADTATPADTPPPPDADGAAPADTAGDEPAPADADTSGGAGA